MIFAMILLNVCNLLQCNVSKLFSRYYGCLMSIRDLKLGPWHKNTIFCTSELMNARLSELCTLKRAIGSSSGHLHAQDTLKRTGKRPARLQARLSVLHFDSMLKNIYSWPRVLFGTVFTNLHQSTLPVPTTSITSR